MLKSYIELKKPIKKQSIFTNNNILRENDHGWKSFNI